MKKDARIDSYINKCGDFARPILNHLRKLVHAACPDVEETMKWSVPHFMYKGMLCSMAAFKQHCAFGFWKEDLVLGDARWPAGKSAHGSFGRMTAISDLPDDKILLGYIKKAKELNEAGIKKTAPVRSRVKKEVIVPDDLMVALRKNKKAQANFESFSYSHKKEYAEWITEAKRVETRQQRLATAEKWIAQGKSRNWKYVNC
ncbi:MAG TPA: YdeI/OmpD-associated family protein [Candidatus Nitrosotalea sp.]|nr:YdeI/OmpD-associated family protein [Candidatus Nitrosotalea sp.]